MQSTLSVITNFVRETNNYLKTIYGVEKLIPAGLNISEMVTSGKIEFPFAVFSQQDDDTFDIETSAIGFLWNDVTVLINTYELPTDNGIGLNRISDSLKLLYNSYRAVDWTRKFGFTILKNSGYGNSFNVNFQGNYVRQANILITMRFSIETEGINPNLGTIRTVDIDWNRMN